MRILVCGGRGYRDAEAVDSTLSGYAGVELICGFDPDDDRYQGADQLAFEWAVRMGAPAFAFPAPWKKFGRPAGPIRNQRMLDWGKPEMVIAFPGGRGTADMCSRAEKAGLKPIRVGHD